MGILDGAFVFFIVIFCRLTWMVYEGRLKQEEIIRRIEAIEKRQTEDLEICRHSIEDMQKIIEWANMESSHKHHQAWEILQTVRYAVPRINDTLHNIMDILERERE